MRVRIGFRLPPRTCIASGNVGQTAGGGDTDAGAFGGRHRSRRAVGEEIDNEGEGGDAAGDGVAGERTAEAISAQAHSQPLPSRHRFKRRPYWLSSADYPPLTARSRHLTGDSTAFGVRRLVVIRFVFHRRDAVDLAEPARQVDVGAAAAAEGLCRRIGRTTADRASSSRRVRVVALRFVPPVAFTQRCLPVSRAGASSARSPRREMPLPPIADRTRC